MSPLAMGRPTATTKPLSIEKAKAKLAQLVDDGKVSAAGAKRIDIRELTPREIAHAETLGRARRRSKAA